eukprot:CAMPEP_0169125902 /NCGR_PEP_ID=MMETSP1015-20121227/35145_1 /TAXON_ID=342587 /ORGANISM="Karlodinium micrum, Strain CCMP2283" /LENGTH=62 /DNA_ID=CAMNT_0009189495 /DNA_START=50 /DNA_END=239 /DNA_ORIENTATION=+
MTSSSQGPADSSDARNPLPGAHNACAVALNSLKRSGVIIAILLSSCLIPSEKEKLAPAPIAT